MSVDLYLAKWTKLKGLRQDEREFIKTELMANDVSGTYYIDAGDEEFLSKMEKELPQLYATIKRVLDEEDGGADFAIF